jgi:hypothetical protein
VTQLGITSQPPWWCSSISCHINSSRSGGPDARCVPAWHNSVVCHARFYVRPESVVSNICAHAGCRDSAKVATVHCILFIGSTSAEPHDEVWWSEGSVRSGSLKVHSLTTGATQVPPPWQHTCPWQLGPQSVADCSTTGVTWWKWTSQVCCAHTANCSSGHILDMHRCLMLRRAGAPSCACTRTGMAMSGLASGAAASACGAVRSAA